MIDERMIIAEEFIGRLVAKVISGHSIDCECEKMCGGDLRFIKEIVYET